MRKSKVFRIRWLFAVVLAGCALAQPRSENAEALLGAALHHERVTGNLQSAIDGYRKVLALKGVSRSAAAQAQFHLGLCYHMLGSQEARKAFESVVRNFPDQAELAEQARTRLAGMDSASAANRQARARLVWDNAIDLGGTVSADGRYISLTDWATGDLAIRDLSNGETRKATDKGGWNKAQGFTYSHAISPDGKRVAFNWNHWDVSPPMDDLRLTGTDGTGERKLYQAAGFIEVYSWSPDGKWIAAAVKTDEKPDTPVRVILIGADTGEQRVVSTRASVSKKEKLTFSPDGKWLVYDSVLTAGAPPSVYVLPAAGTAAETEVVKDARAMGWTPDGKAVLFTRERNGVNALYLVPVSQGKAAGAEQQIRSVPNAGSSLGMTRQGALFFGVTNEQTDALVTAFDVRTASIGKTLVQLPIQPLTGHNNAPVMLSADGMQLLCIVEPKSVVIRSVSTGTEFLVSPRLAAIKAAAWARDGKSLLIMGVGTDQREGLYRVDLGTQATSFVASLPANGGWLPFAVSGDAKMIYHRNRQGHVVAHSVESGEERVIFDKVPWRKFDQGPMDVALSHDENWIAIRASRSVSIVNLRNSESRLIYTRNDDHVIYGLDWSPDDKYVLVLARDFRAKTHQVWSLPAGGGEPVRQPVSSLAGQLRGLSVSADGKLAAFVRSQNHQQVWAVENFLPKN